MKKIKIGIIYGGQSSEHEVSIVSAKSVMSALNKSRYQIVPIKISKRGKWSYLPAGKAPLQMGHMRIKIDNPTKFLNKLDIVFPLIHGTTGEDGGLQGLLEFLNIPYVGAGVMDSALGMDKVVQKRLFQCEKLPVVNFKVYLEAKSLSKHPCFVKPARCGSSVGISRVDKAENLEKALNLAKKYDSKVLIEEAVPESREFECAVLGNKNPKASVVGEVVSSNVFYDYNAKYIDGKSKTIIPAKISKKLSDEIRNLSIRAYRAIDCSGMARVDFLYNSKKKKLFINEVNTIPGFTSISMYPKLWGASGLTYSKLLDELVKLGLNKHTKKQKLLHSYEPKKSWWHR